MHPFGVRTAPMLERYPRLRVEFAIVAAQVKGFRTPTPVGS